MRFDVHVAKPLMLISDSLGHGFRRTYMTAARVSRSSGGFMDMVAIYIAAATATSTERLRALTGFWAS